MVKHTKICQYEGCFSVWVGPWGTFIGGREGKRRFDMTLCADGRELNHGLGWDYLDPCRSLYV